LEAGTVPEKVSISHRGARYEIGMGKRYYAVWVVDAPRTDPIDRWPETPEGWSQAWARFTALETPGTIAPVPRRHALAVLFRRGSAAQGGGDADSAGGDVGSARRRVPARLVAGGLLAVGIVAGIAGLFPAYFTGQSLASASDQLVPHILYLVGWTAALALILTAGVRTRIGGLLGTGLSAVTFGLFAADLATGTSGHGGVGAGMVISLIGWLACAAGSAIALRARPATATPGPQTTVAQTAMAQSAVVQTGVAQTAVVPTAIRSGVGRPRKADAGPVTLLALCAIGAAACFVPSWDSYTLTSSGTTPTTETVGNAFQNPGTVIAADMAAVVALVVVAIVAALWRPGRHGAALAGGAVVAMAAQAVSALIQSSQPTSPEMFGISAAQAQSAGLTISSGLTSIFWVYVVFVIALAISAAWLATAPSHPSSAVPLNQGSPNPGPDYPVTGYVVPGYAGDPEPAASDQAAADGEPLAKDDDNQGSLDSEEGADSEVSAS
jgi:hypothetical protein